MPKMPPKRKVVPKIGEVYNAEINKTSLEDLNALLEKHKEKPLLCEWIKERIEWRKNLK